ncbi:MAG: DUF2141 domain-containing protein [Gemmatimonadales bacterium]|nr:DUF2141 domain-containing protein [Gemmatimonadales bacterium]
MSASRGSRFVVAALLLGAAAGLPAQAPGIATLTVTVTGVRAEQGGELVVALYDRASAWLSPDSARAVQRLVPAGDSAVAVFAGLPFDSSLAIAVIHDRNRNGRMDMRWFPFPKPKEGAGVSRNHQRMGKPRYAEAVFTLYNAEEAQRIALRY